MTDKYEFIRLIGKGRQGQVYEGKRNSDGAMVAIKQILKSDIKNLDDFKMRVKMQMRMKHYNILQIYELCEELNYYYIVYELCQSGEILECLADQDEYTEFEARCIIRSVLEPLMFLHLNFKPHMNIKPSNILIDTYNNLSSVKLSDFGSLDYIYDGLDHRYESVDCYPPEIFLKKHSIGAPVDMWSVGVVTYILLSGESPFETFDDLVKGRFEFRSQSWFNVSKEAKDFIKKLIVVSPFERMTAEEAYDHPFITGKRDYADLYPILDTICWYNLEKKKPRVPIKVKLPKNACDPKLKFNVFFIINIVYFFYSCQIHMIFKVGSFLYIYILFIIINYYIAYNI